MFIDDNTRLQHMLAAARYTFSPLPLHGRTEPYVTG